MGWVLIQPCRCCLQEPYTRAASQPARSLPHLPAGSMGMDHAMVPPRIEPRSLASHEPATGEGAGGAGGLALRLIRPRWQPAALPCSRKTAAHCSATQKLLEMKQGESQSLLMGSRGGDVREQGPHKAPRAWGWGVAPQNPLCSASLNHAGWVIPQSHLSDGWMRPAALQVAASLPQGQAAAPVVTTL